MYCGIGCWSLCTLYFVVFRFADGRNLCFGYHVYFSARGEFSCRVADEGTQISLRRSILLVVLLIFEYREVKCESQVLR
jgi:hypothetical protein